MKNGLVRTGLMIAAVAGMVIGNVAGANDYSPPKIYTVTPTGVNLSDGSYTFTETDLTIGPLSLDRFYISGERDPNTKFFGPRVTSNFDIYVARNLRPPISPGVQPRRWAPIVHIGATSAGVYTQASLTAPVNMGTSNLDANTNVLDWVSGHYVFTSHDGTVYTFGGPAVTGNASGERVTSIAFTDGRTQAFSYNGSGQLTMVSDSSGYALIFDYNGSGLISAACGFNLSQTYVTATLTCSGAALVVSYGYTSGLLTSVTGVDGQVTNYTRAGNEIGCIKPPGYTVCKVATTFVYGVPHVVSQQTLGDGKVWNYSASGDYSASRTDDAVYAEDPTASTTVTDPNGKASYYRFSKSSPYSFTDANNRTTTYVYTGGYENEWSTYGEATPPPRPEGSLLLEATMPEGNKYKAEYNGPYNSISKETFVPKSGTGGAVIQYGYSCSSMNPSCTKPLWKQDPKGNQTDFAYTAFGAIQSEMLPPPTSGAARPLKLYTYVQKYAYVKDAGGSLVALTTPIWLPDTMTECQTVAGSGNGTATCDTSAPQRVTSYQYGANGTANNLLVRGIAVTAYVGVTLTTLRTCFSYDARGRKISTTTPNASLTVCP